MLRQQVMDAQKQVNELARGLPPKEECDPTQREVRRFIAQAWGCLQAASDLLLLTQEKEEG